MVIFHSYVSLPEGTLFATMESDGGSKTIGQSDMMKSLEHPPRVCRACSACSGGQGFLAEFTWYPLVNMQKAIENGHLSK